MWFYVDRIWAPPPEMHYSDLYPRWYGSRELLLHGRDPYGPEVTHEIQLWAYGRPVDTINGTGPRDENRFAYPLYIAFLLAPTVRLPFATVQKFFWTLDPLLALAGICLWLDMLGWRSSRPIWGAVLLLSFASFPVLESIYLQQPGLLAVLFLAGAGAALTRRRLGLAGALFGLASIKPQLVALLTAWLLVWAFSEWRSRKRLVLGFGITMLVLLGFSELLLPGWFGEWVKGVRAYQHYTGNTSILSTLLTHWGGTAAAITLLVALATIVWPLRHEAAQSDRFRFAFVLILAVTVVVIPTVYPTGQVVLLPALYWLLKNFPRIWVAGRATRLAYVALWSLLGWPWLAAFALILVSLFLPFIRKFWIVPVSTLLLVPLTATFLLILCTPMVLRSGQVQDLNQV